MQINKNFVHQAKDQPRS